MLAFSSLSKSKLHRQMSPIELKKEGLQADNL
jgi:hypothetical protein